MMETDRRFSRKLALSEDDVSAARMARADRHGRDREQLKETGQTSPQRNAREGLLSRATRSFVRSLDRIAESFSGKRKRDLEALRQLFDEEWYITAYPDVVDAYPSGWQHFLDFGLAEGRNPNRFFDADWYLKRYGDARASDHPAIIHYLKQGAAELRDPHPDFDARWYAKQHAGANKNPLLHHVREGQYRNHSLRQEDVTVLDQRSSSAGPDRRPHAPISVVVPIYKGLDESRACLDSVLNDTGRYPDEIIVIDDCSPEPEISRWLQALSTQGAIRLIRNPRNLGFVASVNAGMVAAGRHDVVLLNSDAIVPSDWLSRLQDQAYAEERIGTVTPLSNNATICSYPHETGGSMPQDYSLAELDNAAQRANHGRRVTIPTAVGFAMYIRRQCLDEVGLFDHETFGLGYGEENDFSLRARQRGWSNILACDTYVYHKGEVSFGGDSARKDRAFKLLTDRYPSYIPDLHEFGDRDPVAAYRFAITAELLKEKRRDTVLMVSHDLGGGTERHIQEIIANCTPSAAFLVLRSREDGCELSVPSFAGHARLHFAPHEEKKLIALLKAFHLKRIHIHHVLGFEFNLREMVKDLGVPFDFTVHDYFAICPRINMLKVTTGRYCGEESEWGCNNCIATFPPPHSPTRNIFEHRWRHDWLLRDAERVICPSDDVRQRLERYGFKDRLLRVPHEATDTPASALATPTGRRNLRVALLGVLAPHKGWDLVRRTVTAARAHEIEFVLIGESEPRLKLGRTCRFRETGRYEDTSLHALIQDIAPDLFWFPAAWPETYSYTLSAALASGVPIVASDLGAFPERLRDHDRCRLVAATAQPAEWIAAFEAMHSWALKTHSGLQG